MMVVITSCAPVRALSRPTSPPHIAPATIAAASARTTWSGAGSSTLKPTHTAAMPPANIWPAAPMLKRPDLNPIATLVPASISGVAAVIVSLHPRQLPKAPLPSATYASLTVRSMPVMSPCLTMSMSEIATINAPSTSADRIASALSLSELSRNSHGDS